MTRTFGSLRVYSFNLFRYFVRLHREREVYRYYNHLLFTSLPYLYEYLDEESCEGFLGCGKYGVSFFLGNGVDFHLYIYKDLLSIYIYIMSLVCVSNL